MHDEFDCARRDLRRRPTHSSGAALGRSGCRQTHPIDAMGRRLDDDQTVVQRQHVAGFAQPGERRAQHLRHRVEPADRAVVGIGDQHGAVRRLGDAERVLHARLRTNTVHEPEVEQTLPDVRLETETVVVDHDRTQRRRLGVGDPDPVAGCTHSQAGRLREPRFVRRTVTQAFGARPGQDRDRVVLRFGREVQRPQLMGTGHCDHRAVEPPDDVPRRGQRLLVRSTASGTLTQLLTRTRLSANPPVGQPDRGNSVVHRVRDQQVVAEPFGRVRWEHTDALRFFEDLRPTESCPFGTQVRFQEHDLVVRGVADDEAAVAQRDGLPREPELRRVRARRDVR